MTAGNGVSNLDWNDVPGASFYEVQQWDGHVTPAQWRTLPFGHFTISKTGSSAVVGGLINNVCYSQRVRSVNSSGGSGWTPWVDVCPRPPLGIRPSAPTGLTVTTAHVETYGVVAVIDWDDTANSTRYQVQQSDGSTWRILPHGDFNLLVSGSWATVWGFNRDGRYTFRVRALNVDLESGWSSEVSIYVSVTPATPTATPTQIANPRPTRTATPTATPTQIANPRPTPTASPTPTPTRIANPTACSQEDLNPRTLGANQTISHTGDWGRACRYFNFDINPTTGRTHVIIDLTGDGLDTTMKLRASDTSDTIVGSVIRENDDNLEESNSQDSRVGLHLRPGYYVVEARLGVPSDISTSRNLTLTVKSEDIIYHPSGDHQEDRTVGYWIREMPLQPEIPNPELLLGVMVPDDHPSLLMPRVVDKGLKKWKQVGRSRWPHPRFCTDACSENSDNHFIEIRAGLADECGDAAACFRGFKEIASNGHHHLTDGKVWLEEPATQVPMNSSVTQRFAWTEDSAKHGKMLPSSTTSSPYLWWLLLPVVLHELGHTLGMDDLYKDTTRNYAGYLMDRPGALQTIPAGDINYLKQIYRQYPE